MCGYVRVFLIIFFVLILNSVYGQSGQKEVLVAGKVINSKTGESVSLAHIILNGKRKVAVCDDWGVYRIVLSPGDSIRVTALGYKPTTYILPDTVNRDTYNDIKLQPTSYKLEEVTVYNLGTWEQFRYNFINMKLEPTKEEKMIANINMRIAHAIKKDMGANLMNQRFMAKTNGQKGIVSTVGFSTGMSFGNKKDFAQKQRIKSLTAQDKYSRILGNKYNREIVSEITGEKKKERLDKLMAYINENGHLTHKTKELEIIETVKKLYAKFLIIHPLKESKFEQDTV
jgi:hypothetical protein